MVTYWFVGAAVSSTTGRNSVGSNDGLGIGDEGGSKVWGF